MDFKKQKNFIFIGIIFAAVLTGYLVFRYLNSSGAENNGAERKTNSGASAAGDSIFVDKDAVSETIPDPSLSSASAGGIKLNEKNFENLNIQEIHGFISMLEKTKLDADFFESDGFKKLIDFSEEVELLESDKGNIYPFSPI